jgi:AcrR family transcriptional regulator
VQFNRDYVQTGRRLRGLATSGIQLMGMVVDTLVCAKGGVCPSDLSGMIKSRRKMAGKKRKSEKTPAPPPRPSRRTKATGARTYRSTERQRLSPLMRRRHLIEEAFAYFAEVGLSGSTRGLAKRVGITQPLLYRYFRTKDSLIEAVYDLIYVNRWRPEWTQTLTDRTVELQARLNFFYKSYADVVLNREWLRIYLFAGLNGAELNKWCIGLLEDRILKTIYRELYAELHAPLPPDYQPSAEEVELVWNLHSAIFYHAVRKHVFQVPVFDDQHATIELAIDLFLSGARRLVALATGKRLNAYPQASPVQRK